MLNNHELERYKRHLSLHNFTEKEQLKLKNSKVLCIGAGGLGSPLLIYLAACGIGSIGIVDMDKVELHNLQRQVIHFEKNINQYKTASAKEILNNINSNCKINTYNLDITSSKAKDLFQNYDIIAVCVDNLEARYSINSLAIKYKKPQISANVVGYDGFITCFKPYLDNKSPCYECLQPKTETNCVKKANDVGVFSPLVGLLGCQMAIEVVRELLNWEHSLNGIIKTISVFNQNTLNMKIKKQKDCLCHNTQLNI